MFASVSGARTKQAIVAFADRNESNLPVWFEADLHLQTVVWRGYYHPATQTMYSVEAKMNTRSIDLRQKRQRVRCGNGSAFSDYKGAAMRGLLVALFVVLCSGISFAQDTTATILGNVTDSTGAAVPKADVTVTNVETNVATALQTNETGTYTAPQLNPGTYSVTIKMMGFRTASIPNLAIAAGDRRRVDASLEVGANTETIEITTQAPVLQTDSSTVASNVTERAVQDLPLNGRNFINLVQIIPGATEASPNSINSGTRPDDRRPSSSVSINGQSEVLNDQLVDGLDNNERVIGTIGVRPAIDSIQEVRIVTNTFSADGGRAGGGLINVITKSGTNTFHGTLYDFFRNDALNANPYQFGAHNRKPELRQNQFGGSLGGPIFKDKAFFFGDAEFFRQIRGGLPSSLTVPSAV